MLVPRLMLPGTVPAGQPQWAVRANQFTKALAEGNLARTYQAPHPGLTVLWLAGAAQKIAGATDRRGLILAASYSIGVASTVLVLLNVWLLWRLLRRDAFPLAGVAALTAGILWATDPLLLTMTGLIGLDGLASYLLITSLLLAALYLRSGGARRAAAAGIATGLAIATKATALPLLLAPPLFGLVAGRLGANRRRVAVLTLATIAATALVVYALLPAAWVNPVGAFQRLLVGKSENAESLYTVALSRERKHFILGEMEAGGGLGYYPLNLAYRTTPLALLGIGAGFAAAAWRRSRLVREAAVLSVLTLVSIMVVSQRYWRYLAPNLALLDLLAALGLAALASRLWARRNGWNLAWAPLAAAGLQAVWVFAAFPYYEFRLNPLFGGLDVGARVVQVGWGAGLEQAQAFLDAEGRRMGRRIPWTGGFGFGIDRKGQEFDTAFARPVGEAFLARADCHVDYIRFHYELRRKKPWEEHRFLVHRVDWNGLELATIWCRRDRGFSPLEESSG